MELVMVMVAVVKRCCVGRWCRRERCVIESC